MPVVRRAVRRYWNRLAIKGLSQRFFIITPTSTRAKSMKNAATKSSGTPISSAYLSSRANMTMKNGSMPSVVMRMSLSAAAVAFCASRCAFWRLQKPPQSTVVTQSQALCPRLVGKVSLRLTRLEILLWKALKTFHTGLKTGARGDSNSAETS